MARARELISEGYISVTTAATVDEAVDAVREYTPEAAATIYYVYVTDADGRLTGVASLRELLNADGGASVTDVMTADVVDVPGSASASDVADAFATHGYPALPVCDSGGILLGIVRFEDAIDAVDERTAKDLLSRSNTFQPFGF
ncbi:CBS domain-containing protein [Halorubrum sp. DTA46]|uniref:CBS domain-containing protein n=1 Tax=Halorubrum sp. DTA46 TaxID=3402162 RepID=UPI003AAB135D